MTRPATRARLEDTPAVGYAFDAMNRLASAFGFDGPDRVAFTVGAKYFLARGDR